MDDITALMYLASGAFVLLAAAGFAMMNIGLSRVHASATQCLISIGVLAVSIICFHLIGNYFMYGTMKVEFFHLALAVLAASIIPGALTERVRIWPLMIFTGFFSAFIFPVIGAWTHETGWLVRLGFHDFANAGLIHVTAGCAALSGSYIMGPRAGKYAPDGRPIPFSASNIPLATLGAMLAVVGWLGLTAGHSLIDTTYAFTNILLGGAGGAVGGLFYVTWRFNKPDTTIIINCLVAGLVAVSAGADLLWPVAAVLLGGAGGILCAYIIPLLDKYKFDDPVGVTPVHLAGGILGILAVIFTGHIVGQIIGLAAIIIVALGASGAVWIFLKKIMGLRCSARAERHGLDMEAVGLEAYADFPIRTAGRPDITQIDKY